jgi:hypothetical protein
VVLNGPYPPYPLCRRGDENNGRGIPPPVRQVQRRAFPARRSGRDHARQPSSQPDPGANEMLARCTHHERKICRVVDNPAARLADDRGDFSSILGGYDINASTADGHSPYRSPWDGERGVGQPASLLQLPSLSLDARLPGLDPLAVGVTANLFSSAGPNHLKLRRSATVGIETQVLAFGGIPTAISWRNVRNPNGLRQVV